MDRLPNLLGLRDVPVEAVGELLDDAARFRRWLSEPGGRTELQELLFGRRVALLFLEASTRTRFSFEVAARNLGAEVLALTGEGSSTEKGEGLFDTARTLTALGADLLVVRHRYAGAPHQLAARLSVPVVNAGDGMHEHPTQALLDVLTLRDRFERLEGLTVGIVGDVRHSRVVGSHVQILPRLGVRVLLGGPGTLCPPDHEATGVEVRHRVDEILEEAHAVMMLRIQHERMPPGLLPSGNEYRALYGLDDDRLRARLLKGDDLLVLHPGPMNRGVEVGGHVPESSVSAIFRQKANGVAIRMAVLHRLLEGRAP